MSRSWLFLAAIAATTAACGASSPAAPPRAPAAPEGAPLVDDRRDDDQLHDDDLDHHLDDELDDELDDGRGRGGRRGVLLRRGEPALRELPRRVPRGLLDARRVRHLHEHERDDLVVRRIEVRDDRRDARPLRPRRHHALHLDGDLGQLDHGDEGVRNDPLRGGADDGDDHLPGRLDVHGDRRAGDGVQHVSWAELPVATGAAERGGGGGGLGHAPLRTEYRPSSCGTS